MPRLLFRVGAFTLAKATVASAFVEQEDYSMGDMADWINDQMYDPFIDGTPEYFLDPEDDNGPASTACRYCLAGSLYWFETDHGWRLGDQHGNLHTCREYKAST